MIRSGALGDTIVSFPAVAALARHGYEVDYAGRPPSIDLALLSGLASRVHSVERMPCRGLYTGAEESKAFVREFDLVVAWTHVPGLSDEARAMGCALVEAPARGPSNVHASSHLLRSLAPLGVDVVNGPRTVTLRPRDSARERALLALGLVDAGYIAIHPSSGSPSKNWPAAQFAALARAAVDRGFRVVWLQGESDESVVSPLSNEVPGVVLRDAGLERLAAVLSGARLYVGNDSGVSHLAAATGVPTLAIFRSTDPKVWAPLGPRVRIVPATRNALDVWDIAHATFSLV